LPKKIAVIDDERTVQATLTAVLQRHGYIVESAPNAAQGRQLIAQMQPDLVMLDLGLPDADGLEVLRELKAARPDLPVMILTAHDSLANAIESIKLGAFHFVPKPYAVEELIVLCARALEQQALVAQTVKLESEKAQLQVKLRAAEEQLAPVAISRRMREVEQLIARVAPTMANVLLTGESGVGKEVFAEQLHRRSAQAGQAMVKLNCGAFPANMIEAELFGYAKGAFTWDWPLPEAAGQPRAPISFHAAAQILGGPFGDDNLIKFIGFWTIALPPGWSLLTTHPFNRDDLPFRTLTGMVDSDRFHQIGLLFPARWLHPDRPCTIEAGTPVAQCIPILREALELDYAAFGPDEEAAFTAVGDAVLATPGVYREGYRARDR